MSFAFNKSFYITMGALHHPLMVEIAYYRTFRVSRVYHDYIMEIYSVQFPIDTIPIHMGEMSIMVDMDWLS